MTKTVYIAGPINGNVEINKQAFFKAAEQLEGTGRVQHYAKKIGLKIMFAPTGIDIERGMSLVS